MKNSSHLKKKYFLVFLFTLFNLPIFLHATQAYAAGTSERAAYQIFKPHTSRLASQFVGLRGRQMTAPKFSPNIFSKRDWTFWDWVFFIVFVLASITFIFCIFHMFSDSSRLPEDIVFAVASLSGTAALPWYLSLFAIPRWVFQISTFICLIVIAWSVTYLVGEFKKYREHNKKPDIFIE